ncbi:hypothetical protein [Rhizobium sp. Root483D2]|uniref:hypothetical protein n=1 Tax=Rhizobium sp. Root483D2 TaxID=1736545 RepID=UPI0007155B16|nr:hypothetical protein [Rhizobium sp. Root483D2]KQY31800.1 hypothetical protein ASD32_04195 [Rhizobium sp. Root483D2]
MARIRFVQDFDYRPTEQSTIGYLAGMEETVKRECADQAIAAGKAVELDGKGKEKANGEVPVSG